MAEENGEIGGAHQLLFTLEVRLRFRLGGVENSANPLSGVPATLATGLRA